MPERIGELIALNEKAFVDPAVELRWYLSDEERSARLARGFLFNDRSTGKHLSPIQIMIRIRDSYFSAEAENVHTVISTYGKGKSHFALVLANYFGREAADPIIHALIQGIRKASTGGVGDTFRAYKEQAGKPDLVICLSGDRPINLRSEFLAGLSQTLIRQGHPSYSAKTIYEAGLKWLRRIAEERKAELEKATEAARTSPARLAGDLEAYREESLETLVEVSKSLSQGFAIDFGGTLNLAEIVKQVYGDLCGGEGKPFHRLLILFDELGLYLENYLDSQRMAGGTALQELLNGVRDLRGKAALVSFIQFEPETYLRRESIVGQEGPERYTSRLIARYRMASCMEYVISGLITQRDHRRWYRFMQIHERLLNTLSEITHASIPSYRDDQQLSESVFRLVVAKGCWPLHPLTTALLCNYDFAEGRTVLGFVQSAINASLRKPANIGDYPNFIIPLEILEHFGENFRRREQLAGSGPYSRYMSVLTQRLGAEAPREEVKALGAIFLYSSGGLTRKNKEDYEQLLRLLSGLRKAEFADPIKALIQKSAIYFDPARQVYDFYDRGSTIQDIIEKAKAEALLKLERHPAEVIDFSIEELKESLPEIEPTEFRDDQNIVSSGWIARQLLLRTTDLDADILMRRLGPTQSDEVRGYVIWLVADDEAQLRTARERTVDVLDKLAQKHLSLPIILGVPRDPTPEVTECIAMLKVMKAWPRQDIEILGIGFENAKVQLKSRLSGVVSGMKRSCDFTVRTDVRNQLKPVPANMEKLLSEVFRCLYLSAPPMDFDLLHSLRGAPGNRAIGAVARKLVAGRVTVGDIQDLEMPHRRLFDQVVSDKGPRARSWQMADDVVHPPLNSRARKCWEVFEELVVVGRPVLVSELREILCKPPYGLDRSYFPLLWAAWYGAHSRELVITGKLEDKRKPVERLGTEEIQAKFSSAKDFLEWATDRDLSVRMERINVKEVEQRLHVLLSRAKEVKVYSEAVEVLKELESEAPSVEIQDELLQGLKKEKNRLLRGVAKIRELEDTISVLSRRLGEARSLRDALAIQEEMAKGNWLPGELDAPTVPQLVENLRERVEKQIREVALGVANQRLERLEQYDLVRQRLEEQVNILEKTGFRDLVQLTRKSLASLGDAKGRITLESSRRGILEQVRLTEVTVLTPLKKARDIRSVFQNYLASELAEATSSEQTVVTDRLREVDSVIDKHESWLRDFDERIAVVTSFDQVDSLSRELERRKALYGATEYEGRVQELEGLVVDLRGVWKLVPRDDGNLDSLEEARNTLSDVGRGSPQLERLADRALKQIETRLSKLWEQGRAWVQKEIQENSATLEIGQVRRKLERLKAPPSIVREADRELLQPLIRQLERVLEEDKVETIVSYFSEIQDEDVRQECLRRLTDMCNIEVSRRD